MTETSRAENSKNLKSFRNKSFIVCISKIFFLAIISMNLGKLREITDYFVDQNTVKRVFFKVINKYSMAVTRFFGLNSSEGLLRLLFNKVPLLKSI